MIYEIPLQAVPNQEFSVDIRGHELLIRIRLLNDIHLAIDLEVDSAPIFNNSIFRANANWLDTLSYKLPSALRGVKLGWQTNGELDWRELGNGLRLLYAS